MKLRSFVVVAWVGALAGVAWGAGDTGAGIADMRVDRGAARRVKVGAPDRERGGVQAVVDERPPAIDPGSLPPANSCDFIGFSRGESVNGAYGGGASSGGVARTNLGVTFAGASVLNAWNGCCSPDDSIAYAPAGSIVMSSSNGSFWRGIEFHHSSLVGLTVETYAGVNAGGAVLQTFSVPANLLANATYSTWTLRQIQFDTVAKSVKISGTANRWGIDAVKITAGCPAPTSGSDDCNGNGQSDACEIATGLVQDCNGNGVPDSCDIAGRPSDIRVSFEEFRGQNGAVIGSQYANLLFEAIPGGASWTALDATSGLYNVSGWDCDAGSGQLYGNGSYWLCGYVGAWCGTNSAGGSIRVLGAGATYFQVAYSAGTPLNLIAYDAIGNQIDIDTKPANTRVNGNASGPGTLRVEAPAGTRIARVVVRDSGNMWVIDSISTDAGGIDPLPDCNTNGIPDSCEIASGAVADCNSNGIPDSCDIAGGMADCNGNGALDSCELASGAAVDQNGNGIPDSCDPFPTLVLTANAAACNAIGSEVDVEARLSGVLNLVVAGQIVLDWDPTKLELVAANPGDAPFASASIVNNAAGQLVVLTPAAPGGSGTTAPSVVVSRLKFRVLGGSCDGSGTSIGFGSYMGMLETAFTDGVGTSIEPTLVASSGFVVDDGAPVLSNVPADVSVQAYAGENGFALVTLGTPTATDACAPGLTATGVRSDGQALGAAWPSGTTTVTWSAVDPCGNTTTATTSVTVDPTNTMDLAAEWGSGFAGAGRSLTLNLLGGSGNQSRTQVVSIPAGGSAMFSVTDLPVDTYTCATIEDPARSLRARVSVSDSGSNWSAASATMVLGDLINDEVIDVLDWGAYIVLNPNADLNADGFINSGDGNIILANFGRRGDTGCTPTFTGPRDPILAITVADVISMGLPELAGADLNGDGWIDQADIDLGR
jgi:hypothetical protein